jgi:hypothetical protein
MAAVVDGVPVAIPPPKDYKVDFANPQRNSEVEAYWLFGVGNVLTLLFVFQRVYVRAVVHKAVRPEDGKTLRVSVLCDLSWTRADALQYAWVLPM